jgi:outer membrane protein assembly factor BamD (BamD/ComL family)
MSLLWGKDDEKYMFSRFLYRIGIDGTNRKTRQILMKNLEGSAWKNLTWKKKKRIGIETTD